MQVFCFCTGFSQLFFSLFKLIIELSNEYTDGISRLALANQTCSTTKEKLQHYRSILLLIRVYLGALHYSRDRPTQPMKKNSISITTFNHISKFQLSIGKIYCKLQDQLNYSHFLQMDKMITSALAAPARANITVY